MANLSTQDYANVALGALCMVGTFMVGKIAVESITAARAERFERKGQPPAAVKSKESTMDGLVKFGGTIYSIYLINQQMPEVIKGVKELLE